MPVGRNSCPAHHLLGSDRDIVGACGRAGFDENIALIPKMNEVFPFVGAEHVSLARCGCGFDEALRQRRGDAEAASQTKEERSTILLKWTHDNLLSAKRWIHFRPGPGNLQFFH